ncbi:MAG TPA: ATP-grasp domain-containing protein [Yaniella sp.]
MANSKDLKIVIASAGRRAHYIQWFKDSLQKQNIPGEVIALDYRATSPTVGLADRAYQTPAYNSPEYVTWIREWFTKERPDLFLCMNDYEMQTLSGELAEELRALGCVVSVLAPEEHSIVLDKHKMYCALMERGIPTPRTFLGSELHTMPTNGAGDEKFVIKHRFGAGSTGLEVVAAGSVAEAVERSAESALGKNGQKVAGDKSAVLVQEFLPGDEFGVDGVFSLNGQSDLMGVLARRTDQMRDGDPDVATTVSGDRFAPLMEQLGALLNPIGTLNVDFREDSAGNPYMIDINPRMGGGYPYCHRAGADMPGAIIRAMAGLKHDPELLKYELGVTTVRREEFTVIAKGTV